MGTDLLSGNLYVRHLLIQCSLVTSTHVLTTSTNRLIHHVVEKSAIIKVLMIVLVSGFFAKQLDNLPVLKLETAGV